MPRIGLQAIPLAGLIYQVIYAEGFLLDEID